jgi:hypothetical protein
MSHPLNLPEVTGAVCSDDPAVVVAQLIREATDELVSLALIVKKRNDEKRSRSNR